MSKVSIKDYCEITSSKRIFANEYLTSGVPFYRGREISEKHNSSSEVSDLIFISKEKYDEIKEKYGVPQKGDLLLTSVGTIGNPYLVKNNKEFYFKDGNLTWFRNFKGIDSKWFYYWLLSPQGRSELNKCTIGSSQKAYTINLLYKLQLDLPNLETQTNISSVISAYDDLIENNEERIRILEEMAQRLYREWFVKFKFPGHEKVKMVDSETEYGEIPGGWQILLLKELIIPQYGYTASAIDDNNHPKYLRGTDINKNSFINWSTVPSCVINEKDFHKYKVCKGDIFIIRMADPGKIGICEVDIKAVFASYLIRLNIKSKLLPYYLYFFVTSNKYQNFITGASSGTTRKSVNSQQIGEINILVPDSLILNKFETRVSLLRNDLTKLIIQNNNLSEIRDLLISQLVTGKRELRNYD
ncbi:MAG: restriction endonuclease subunit S [Patescibacteria group bacterium]